MKRGTKTERYPIVQVKAQRSLAQHLIDFLRNAELPAFLRMKHIAYMSRAVRPLSDQDLEELLTQCRRDNAQHGITGILFYSHGNIAQLFEGEEAVADSLFARIARDGRHSHVTKLIDRPIAARSFAEWTMAFHPIEAAGFEALRGFFLPHHVPPTPTSLPIADALLVELVRLAVFGPDPSAPYQKVFPELPGPAHE